MDTLSDKAAALTKAAEDLAIQAGDVEDDAEQQSALLDIERVANAELRTEAAIREGEMVTLRAENQALRARLDELEGMTTDPVSQPARAPRLEVTYLGNTFRPIGEGERELNEVRWWAHLSEEVRVGCDLHDTGRLLLWFGYHWDDIPPTALVLSDRLVVSLDGRVVYDNTLRLHPHQSPPLLLLVGEDGNLLPLDGPLGSLAELGYVPNYDPLARPSEVELAAMAAGTSYGQGAGSWARWNPTGGYDLISEEFARVTGGFTGGVTWGASNEAAPHHRAFVGALTTDDGRAWRIVYDLALTAGNYEICYFSRKTGRPTLPAQLPPTPVLVGDGLPSGTTAAGVKLPPPDIAHAYPLVAPWALLGESRWAREMQQCWALLPVMTKKGAERTSGNIYSGQIRAAAWGLRDLWYAHLSCPEGERRQELATRIRYNLEWMAANYARPGGPNYRPDGVSATIKRPPVNAYTQYIRDTAAVVTSTWQHWYMIVVLEELRLHGFPEAEEMERHLLRVAEAMWRLAPSHYDSPWPYVVVGLDGKDAAVFVGKTFAGRTTTPAALMGPNTPELVGAYLAALAAGVNLRLPWAAEALAWLRPRAAAEKGGIPITWNILPWAPA